MISCSPPLSGIIASIVAVARVNNIKPVKTYSMPNFFNARARRPKHDKSIRKIGKYEFI